MKKLIAISTLAILVACSQAADEETADPATTASEDAAAHVGSALVTQPDGTVVLAYSTPDGKTYGGPLPAGYEPGTWELKDDGQACVTPAGEEQFCFTSKPSADGQSSEVVNPDGTAGGSFVRLGAPAVEGEQPSGLVAFLVTPPDGDPFLTTWTSDGKVYNVANPGEGTWRAEGGKRCGTGPGQTEESCSTPGPMGADGTFEATSDSGDAVKVRFLT